MAESTGSVPPSADQIERRFRSLPVRLARPVVVSGVHALRIARRFSWEAEGLERLEGLDQPLVFAANHRSHTDTGAILGTLPRAIRDRTAVAAALDVFGRTAGPRTLRNEAIQLIVAAGFHAFAFDRHGSPLRSIRTSVDLIRSGWNLLLYPEGTRTRDGRLGPFKAGVGVLARFTGRPVVPIYVEGGDQVQPYGRFLPGNGRLTVYYGEPMTYRRGEAPADFVDRLREKVARLGGQASTLTVSDTLPVSDTVASS